LNDPTPFLPEPTVWYIIRQVATGLNRMHTLKLVHMDIKPENILITEDGVLKLGDLGMARPVDTNEDGLEGDARYIAPELLNSPIKTRQLDLFSLGVMIWELAAGRNPPKEGDLWRAFRDGHAPDPSTYVRTRSKELCTLVKQLMSPRPRHRKLAEEILAMTQVQNAKHDTFIVDVIRRSRQDSSKRRRTERPMSSSTSSRSFQHISSLNGDGLSIRVPSFDAFSASTLRDGMSTPTDQTFSHDYANVPTFGTPTNKK
jgi:serine/threonine protein kinase